MQQQLESFFFLDKANILPHRPTNVIKSALYGFLITFCTWAEMSQAFASNKVISGMPSVTYRVLYILIIVVIDLTQTRLCIFTKDMRAY